MFQQESVSHLQLCLTCAGGSFTFQSRNLQSNSDRDWTRVSFWCPPPRLCVYVCVRERGVFFFFSLKLKFGVHSCVIGGLERATEPQPRCLSCHVGGVDLVILWESKVPLTAAWGVIHRAPHEEGRGASHIVCNATYELGWRPRATWKRGNGDFVAVC